MKTRILLLVLFLGIGTATRATNFISDIMVSTHTDQTTAMSQLTDAGYTPVNQDMNQGGGGHYVYIGYKTYTNAATTISALGHRFDDYGVCTRTAGQKHYSHAQGDVTLDGRLSVADIVRLVYAVMNGHWANADYDDNGVIDASDFEALVNALLSSGE